MNLFYQIIQAKTNIAYFRPIEPIRCLDAGKSGGAIGPGTDTWLFISS
jgi:hypothetical protein